MRTIWKVACLSLLSLQLLPARTALAAPQFTPRTPTEKEIIDASEMIDRGIREVNTDMMAVHISDDLEYTNQFGELISKSLWLSNKKSGKLKDLSLIHDVVDLHVYGDSALLIGISHTTFIYNGKTSSSPRRFTRFFIKQNGVWLMVAQHVCTIADQKN